MLRRRRNFQVQRANTDMTDVVELSKKRRINEAGKRHPSRDEGIRKNKEGQGHPIGKEKRATGIRTKRIRTRNAEAKRRKPTRQHPPR